MDSSANGQDRQYDSHRRRDGDDDVRDHRRAFGHVAREYVGTQWQRHHKAPRENAVRQEHTTMRGPGFDIRHDPALQSSQRLPTYTMGVTKNRHSGKGKGRAR
jgi:hypothetical protein